MNTDIQGSITFIETTTSYALIAVRLHSIKQHNAVVVLKKIERPCAVLILGQFKGMLLSSPLLLKQHLGLRGTKLSYEETRNLFRFIERLVHVLEEESAL